MPPPALRIDQVTKRFGPLAALAEVNLEVDQGDFFGLVGMNGAGKTTLIKCLLDANRAEEGRIELFGIPSTRTEARSSIAFVPERFNAPFYATGRDFLRLMLRLYGQRYDEALARSTISSLDLDAGALDKPVRAFSKGMTQKLGLACALLAGRPMLVLDEPTSGLDPKARALLKAVLRERHAGGATVFITSHALADVDEMCSRMAVLHRGHLRYVGRPAQLRASHGDASLEQAFLRLIDEPRAA
jgi:ABC-2 type transport system ATP-binding protein